MVFNFKQQKPGNKNEANFSCFICEFWWKFVEN